MIIQYNFDSNFSSVLHDEGPPKQVQLTLNEPVIIRVTNFNESASKNFINDMARAHTTGQKIIPVICDSYGGQAYSLLAMIDVLEKSKIPVATIIEGKAMSAGVFFAVCGTKGYRYVAPNATIMIHDISSGSIGKVSEIQSNAKETERLNKKVFNILDQKTGKEKDFFWNKLQDQGRADWYFNAKTAKKYRLVDHIGIPDFNIKVNISQRLTLRK